MRNSALQQAKSSRSALPRHRSACRARYLSVAALAALLAAGFLFSGTALAAQAAPTSAPAQKPTTAPASEPASGPAQNPATAQAKPDWPVDNKPSAATVDWDSKGLSVVASNSSLDQILREISMKTGIKVQGMGADERIFGVYGPGSASDVLSELLDGSSYNVIMIGDKGRGTPREIVLSGRMAAPAQSAGNNNPSPSSEEDSEAEPQFEPPIQAQPPLPQRGENGGPPGVPVRTPQQILQEMQQRQRQLQQQQQQQNQQN